MDVELLSQVAARFNHAVMMVAQLIPHTNSLEFGPVVQIACLEDWFTNYRLLIEFLLDIAPKNCASAVLFVPSWRPDAKAREALRPEYGWASQDVSHIGQPSPTSRGGVDPPTLREKAEALLAVVEQFANAMTAARSEYAEFVHIHLRGARKAIAAQDRA